MKKENSSKFSKERSAELAALAAMPDDEIDLSDAPEVKDWSGAKRGLFYQVPLGKKIIPVDADVVEWFQAHAKETDNYQVQINQALRQYVTDQARKAG